MSILFDSMPTKRQLNGESIDWVLKAEKTASTHSLAEDTVTELLGKMDIPFQGVSIKNDTSGAPYADLKGAPDDCTDIFLSLTDDSGWCGCIAAVSEIRGSLKGVGIDIMPAAEAADVLTVYPPRLRRSFSSSELYFVNQDDEGNAVSRMAMLISAKESAFKSMSEVLRKYREMNNGEKLPVSFMDIEIECSADGLFKAAPTGLLLEICKKEGLETFIESKALDALVGTLAVCKKKR